MHGELVYMDMNFIFSIKFFCHKFLAICSVSLCLKCNSKFYLCQGCGVVGISFSNNYWMVHCILFNTLYELINPKLFGAIRHGDTRWIDANFLFIYDIWAWSTACFGISTFGLVVNAECCDGHGDELATNCSFQIFFRAYSVDNNKVDVRFLHSSRDWNKCSPIKFVFDRVISSCILC